MAYMVIGVDFGMTCTGITFSQAPRWPDPKPFQQWTTMLSDLANKVPSKIAYSRSTGKVHSWGFYCPEDDPDVEVHELFKLNLDPAYVDPYEGAPSTLEARRWYLDYLRCIYSHVTQYFSNRVPGWESATVQFVFSVPTTWRNPKVVADIEAIVKKAGFGSGGTLHTARVTLNEAEAAAIAIARQDVQFNDLVMVCDAGGGTTDVSVLKLRSQPGEETNLMPMLPVEGGWYGSALIDMATQQLLVDRLNPIRDRLQASPEEAAQTMINSTFERFKCAFGGEKTDIPKLPFPVLGLPAGSNLPEAGVVNSYLIITREELQTLFDHQVHGILKLIDAQLEKLRQVHPSERVSFLVLSGGLGASPYLRKRIMAHFDQNSWHGPPSARGLKVLLAEQPQVAVAHGLVADRVQVITHKVGAIRERPSRLSYGVVCDQVYREDKHVGENIRRDPRDGQRWATAQIEWIIKQGDKVPIGGVAKEFKAKIERAQLAAPWKAQIVISAYPADQLPPSMAHDGVVTLCIVESSLTGVKTKMLNQHWWSAKKKHSTVEFDLKVIPGSADLTFQLWSDKKMISMKQENVGIVWNEHSMPKAKEAGV